jgi:hypothetical protein
VKATYVVGRTRNISDVTRDTALDHEMTSPTISEVGSDFSDEDIYEHIDEIVPSKKERYETHGPAIWYIQGYRCSEQANWTKAIDYYQQAIKSDSSHFN